MQVAFSGKRSHFRSLLPFAALLAIAVLTDCADTQKNRSTLAVSGNSPGHAGIAPLDTSKNTAAALPPGSTVADTASDTLGADTLLENPSVLIETAKKQCADGDYASADTNLKRAVKAIEAIDAENADTADTADNEEWLPASEYLKEIVAIYAEKMPAPFSVPDDITMAAFQSQMMRSIDSMKFLPSDSLSIAALVCRKDLSYDIPMVWNERVQRALFFYVSNRSAFIDKWFTRASYYLPVMRKMFADSGLPQDLAYLPLIESGFNPRAYSYAHASGIWQFISSTGKTYGLRHNYWLDERRDPLKATGAAILYLRKLYNDFSNWHLALAAYNCGENGVSRAIRRKGTNDYWKLPLPNQTKSYVPFYLAAVTIAKNPKCFSLSMPQVEPFALDTVLLNDCIVLNDIADGLGIPIDTLSKINPHFLRWCTPPDDSNAVLYLPKGQKKAFLDLYAKLPPEKKVKWVRYRVQQGETIQKIAAKFTITVACIAAINHLVNNRLNPERALFLPLPVADSVTTSVAFIPPESHDDDFSDMTTYRVRKGDNLGKIARRYHIPLSQLFRLNHLSRSSTLRIGRVLVIRRAPVRAAAKERPPAVAALPGARPDTTVRQAAPYVVQQGDTPFSIAQKNSISVADLIAWNRLDEKNPVIRIGDTLNISGSARIPSGSDSLTAITAKQPSPQSSAVAQPGDSQKVSGSVPVAGVKDSLQSTSAVPGASLSTKDSAVTASRRDTPSVNGAALLPDSTTSRPAPAVSTKTGKNAVPAEAGAAPAPRFYRIKKGDNLFRVSVAFSVPLQALLDANDLSRNSMVRIGDSVRIPDGARKSVTGTPTTAPGQRILYYKVRNGDTMWRIASSFGVSIEEIYKHNKIKPDSVLIPGEIIKIIKAGQL